MPSRLDTPVLTVDVSLIHKVDTRNVENLFSMWTGEHPFLELDAIWEFANMSSVFSRCAGSLEEGRRLENLSWRLWNRETFCCDPVFEANATTPISISSRSSEGRYSTGVPSLSGSLDSLADEEALELDTDNTLSSTSGPLDITHPQIRRQDSCNSRSRGRERHITPDDLEKMVITIKEKKDLEPLSLSMPSYLPPLPEKSLKLQHTATATPQDPTPTIVECKSLTSDDSDRSAQPASSDSPSGASERSSTSVVRGFSLSHVSSSYRSIPLLSAPSSIPTADLAAATTSKAPQPKKHQMFALGGSSEDSMSEQTNSIESSLQPAPQQKKKNTVFSFGGSSNEEESSLPQKMKSQQPTSALTESIQKPLANKKQTSFKEEAATRTIKEEQPFDDDVFETDEEDEIDESAIDDDDDSSDWEDSIEDSGNASIDEKTFFQRVDSRPNLTSRRSLITTMLHQNDRANALATAASKSTPAMQRSLTASPNGPSVAPAPDSDDASPLMMKMGLKPIAEIPQLGAQPIIKTTTNTTPHQMALSPRTTRRNMLATELTVSLRQDLLWERWQKSQTANAVLKRRHTAHDVVNLTQYPEKAHMEEGIKASWNLY
jgi:Protein of unknown function (DUF3295)/Fungal protein of unknown function (DUF1752)